MPWSTCNRFVANTKYEMMFSLWKRLTIVDIVEGLRSVGTRFRL